MLISDDRKPFFLHLETDGVLQTHQGILQHNDLIGVPWGSVIKSHLGASFYILEPALRDLLLYIKRRSQIVFPKDIGYIILRLSVGPGQKVIEAGTGSGALTTALAWMVGAQGKVFSYDRREDMQALALRNLQRVGLENRVEFRVGDIAKGFDEKEIDSIFLDLPNPQIYLPHVRAALSNGGTFGSILPTTNQVTDLLQALQNQDFTLIDVCEIYLRFYKPVPERLRPTDRMVAHTGYLIFARHIIPEPTPEARLVTES